MDLLEKEISIRSLNAKLPLSIERGLLGGIVPESIYGFGCTTLCTLQMNMIYKTGTACAHHEANQNKLKWARSRTGVWSIRNTEYSSWKTV